MRVALCQPYLFPYVGYYQLVHHVDRFVFYDDVNFSKNKYSRGNTILSNGKCQAFSMAVIGASSYKRYNELSYADNVKKLVKTIEYAYTSSLNFADFISVVRDVLQSGDRSVPVLNAASVTSVLNWVQGSKTEMFFSSEIDYDRSAGASDKIIQIVKALSGTSYINPIGGIELYDKSYFADSGLELGFLRSIPKEYKQIKVDEFQPNLSMIDLCMNIERDLLDSYLASYEIV